MTQILLHSVIEDLNVGCIRSATAMHGRNGLSLFVLFVPACREVISKLTRIPNLSGQPR